MGPIETAVRKEVPDTGALAEIAYKLAFSLDNGDGSVAMVKELRTLLAELRPRTTILGMGSMQLDSDDDDDHEDPLMEGGRWINGEKVD
jgi:hypothetical protein